MTSRWNDLAKAAWAPALLLATCTAWAAGATKIPDAELPVIETGVAMLPNARGPFAWLDAHTLAITTFAGDPRATNAWTSQQVVAFDTRNRQRHTLVPQGRLSCTNPPAGVVSAVVGDTRAYFQGSEFGPAPATQWFKWDGAANRLVPWPERAHPNWNSSLCRQTLAEDVRHPMPGADNGQPRLYLQPGEGFITWHRAFGNEPQPVRLISGDREIALDVTSDRIGLNITHLPFLGAHLLSAGLYRWTDKRGEQRFAALLLRANGQIERAPFPPALAAYFTERRLSSDALLLPVAGGSLVIVAGSSAAGGGLYLTRDGKSSRIWFAGAPDHESFRIMSAIEVSPDGCRAAFDARWPITQDPATLSLEGSVKIIELCAKPK
ncbi:hypothetical protein [Ideonella sp.]|uniref:hypothetical protein n=1 Tax=Ideonella sp. TaxID=1929293 RepID=UPI0035B1BF9B